MLQKRQPILFLLIPLSVVFLSFACTSSPAPTATGAPPTRAGETSSQEDGNSLSPSATLPSADAPSTQAVADSPTAPQPSHTTSALPTQKAPVVPSDDPWMISLQNYQRIGLLERLGGMPLGGVYLPVFSPDGKWLLVPGAVGTALYEADSMTLQWSGVQRQMASFAPDGSLFYFMSRFSEDIEVRRVPDGAVVKVIELEKIEKTYQVTDEYGNVLEEYTRTGLHTGQFLISPDARTLAGINDYFRTVMLWDMDSGKFLAELDFSKMVEYELDMVQDFAFSMDGSVLFIGMNSGGIFQVNLENGELRRSYRSQIDPENYQQTRTTSCEIWADNGTAMAAFCTFYILDPQTDSLVSTTYVLNLVNTNGGQSILESFVTKEGAMLEGFIPGASQAVMHISDTHEIWDFSSGKIKKTTIPFCNHQYEAYAPLAANRTAAVGTATEGRLDVCELSTGTKLASLSQPYTRLASTAIGRSGEGYHIATGDCAGELAIWDARSGEKLRSQPVHTGCITSMAFSADGRYLVTGGEDKKVALWDVTVPILAPLFTYEHPEAIVDVAISYDGGLLASVSPSQLQVWNAGGENVQTQPLDGAMAVTLGPDNWLAYMDGELIYWDDAFSPEGMYQPELGLLAANRDITSLLVNNTSQRFLLVLDAVNSTSITEIENPANYPFRKRVGFSPDGCLIIGVNETWGFDFWKTSSFEELSGRSYLIADDDFDHRIADAAISHDGHLIVMAGMDGSLQVWGLPGVLDAPVGSGVPETTCGEVSMPTATPVPTETPIPPTATPMTLTRSLYLMEPTMRGDDVLALQKRLQELGYTEVGEPDGVFGKMTDEAVRHYQQDNDLVVDGIVGPKTWEKLFGTQ